MMTPIPLFYHLGTPLSLHLLSWLLSLPSMNNPRFRNLRMTLSLFRSFLPYPPPLFHHPPLQSLLQTARFFQVLHLIRLLSSLPGDLAANDVPRFGKIRTGTSTSVLDFCVLPGHTHPRRFPFIRYFLLLTPFRRTRLRDQRLHPLCLYQFSFGFPLIVVLVRLLYVPIFSRSLCMLIHFTSVPRF